MGRLKVVNDSSRLHGREQSFELLYRESYDRVYGYVRIRVRDEVDVEDIVAEAFLKAARAFARFDPSRSKFSTWVISIAGNLIVDHWRQTRTVVAIEAVPGSFFSVPDDTGVVDDRELVGQLLGVLRPEEADLVLMKYWDGKRNIDIASELGMNQSTVSTKLFNAIQKMRAAAKELGVQ